MALVVMRNEVDGWDVVREDEGVALSNHPNRELAEQAAEIRAAEERIRDIGDEPVLVDTTHVHGIDDARQGMKPVAAALVGLLAAVTLLVIIISAVNA